MAWDHYRGPRTPAQPYVRLRLRNGVWQYETTKPVVKEIVGKPLVEGRRGRTLYVHPRERTLGKPIQFNSILNAKDPDAVPLDPLEQPDAEPIPRQHQRQDRTRSGPRLRQPGAGAKERRATHKRK